MGAAHHDINDYNKSLTSEERKKNASRAGTASGESRAQKKLMREALSDFLESKVSTCSYAKEIAEQYGITEDIKIKTLFVVSCTLNTLNNGTVKDLNIMLDLLKETEPEETNPNLKALINAIGEI